MQLHIHDRVPFIQPVSTALLDFSFEEKIHIDTSQEDTGDETLGPPKTEWQLASSIHHHPFAETVDVPPAPAMTVKQELMLLRDPFSSGKVDVNAYCLKPADLLSPNVEAWFGIWVIESTTHPTKYIQILWIFNKYLTL